MQPWFELAIELPQPFSEAMASALFDLGTTGLESSDHGECCQLTAYFKDYPDIGALLRFSFALTYGETPCWITIRTRPIADEDWSENWKAHFAPIRVANLFFIHPPWIPTPDDGSIGIEIDPGMAFGTGQHATTRGCLSLIANFVRPAPPLRALDLGTGSGVLAIALAKLGSGEVWAIDNDPIACACTVANAERNGVHLKLGSDLTAFTQTAGLIVANLFADLLITFSGQLRDRLEEQGTLICSGFLGTDEMRVTQAFGESGLLVVDRYEESPWVTLAFQFPKS